MCAIDLKASATIDPYDEYLDSEYIPSPCQQGCPLGTDIPSYVGLIAEKNFEAAFEVISAANPFPAICGRVCAKPCESRCRRGESDGPVAIRNLKRFVTDLAGIDLHREPVPVTKSKSIAVVGAGPTGLTAAHDLAVEGYEVHVYEKSDSPGGMMTWGIPAFRLPRRLVEADIQRVLDRCPGIKLHLGTGLGETVSLEDLKERHDAVLLALGLWRDRKLGIPGEEDGIEGIHGIQFLTDINRGKTIPLKGNVVVVGGGNVAIDVARTALRAGAAKVELFCLEARDEMPAHEYEIAEAVAEGIEINPSWGPKRILHENGRVSGIEFMRCTSVFDRNGRFNPAYDPKTVVERDATAVLVAIGLAQKNEELERAGLLERGYVRADFETMRTSDSKVFAAGDGAFGPSAIVHAIHHGHRAAHYIKSYLEGIEEPEPYKIKYGTRRVPVIQDPLWEKLSREEQEGRAVGSPLFEECECTYDVETAKRQATRCLRCDAETGTAGYSRRTREHIHAMACTEPGDAGRLRELLQARLRPRNNPFPSGRPAQLDDIVFLPAALTRLVIDPYREACSTRTPLGKSFELKLPFLFAGFDDAPAEVREALARAMESKGCAYIGSLPLEDADRAAVESGTASGGREPTGGGLRLPWLQLIAPGKDVPRAEADGLIYVPSEKFEPVPAKRLHPGQLLGILAPASNLSAVIPYALENDFDLLLLDGTSGAGKSWVELEGVPDLTVIRDAIRILRELNREEDIYLVYFGGLRSGTDAAKILALNGRAVVFGVAMGLAMGGEVSGATLTFNGGATVEDRRNMAENWIRGTLQETAIIARCTGKTNVHNLEPEDMRSITLTTSDATDIPPASGRAPREYF